MAKNELLPPGMTPREYYGSELKRLREATDPRVSQEKLGLMTFVSGAYIGLLETAVRVPRLELSMQIDQVLSTGGVLERIHQLMNFSKFPDYFKDTAEHEQRAKAISEYAGHIVPGVLQTPEYARAIFLDGAELRTDDELDDLVAARMERACHITREDGPELWYILDEAVLRRVVGGNPIMAEQLRHLADLINRRRLILQVVTFGAGAHALLSGVLSLMSFEDEPPLAYSEGPFAGQLLDDQQLVAKCTRAYDLVRAAALSRRASLTLIESVAEEYERAQD
ncbi:DUF5753 domain-containing protein [Kitasatospora sp. NPDC093806]|uniref:DUF5753 domain-containing protein n=1 Tax=Kitasatospora sp. NPDC093806 TaxID=3155075 RepID=UPI0034133B74